MLLAFKQKYVRVGNSKFALPLYALMALFLALFLSALKADFAHAAYPMDFCEFSQSSDGKKITADCTDDQDNGTLDGAVYTESGRSTFTYKDEKIRGDTCDSKIQVSNDKAKISGSYTTYTLSTAADSYECTTLTSGNVTLTRSGERTTAYVNNIRTALNKLAEKNCQGEAARQSCEENSRNQIQACLITAGVAAGGASIVTDNFTESFRNSAIPCVDENLQNVSRAEVTAAYNEGDTAGQAAADDIEDLKGDEAASEDETTNCAVDGVGWMVCPIMNFIAGLNDQAFGFISENFLYIDPEFLANDDTEAAWKGFRDIANVAFVIAFIIIIYSQLTSAGISNYGIKRMLPRLFIAAVLVNVSYILCQLAVDVSNVVGNSVASLVGTTMPTTTAESATIENTDLPLWKDVTAGLLVAGAAIAVGFTLLAIIGPVALLALAAMVLILIARKAIVILLVVVSPIAFVAYLLPNTEQIFKKWWTVFKAMLMLYPVIGMVFGASLLAARVINNSSDDPLVQLTALGVIALPLFAVPLLMRGAMATTGQLGAKLNGLSERANRSAGAKGKERAAKYGKGFKDAAMERALNRGGMVGGIAGMGVRGRHRFDALDRRRKAAEGTYLNREGSGSATRERRALMAEETSGLVTGLNKNAAKMQHMAENHDLHDQATQSDLRLKDTEAIHHNNSGVGYVNNNAGLRTQAIQSGIDLSNTEETVKNDATAGHIAANPNQYQALSTSRGNVKEEQLRQEHQFEDSNAGRTQAGTRQDLEDQLKVVKGEQTRDYKNSGAGVTNAQRTRVVDGQNKTSDKAADLVYEQSSEGQQIYDEMTATDGELTIQRAENKNRFDNSTPGIDIANRTDAANQRTAITKSKADSRSLSVNEGLHLRSQAASDTLEADKTRHSALVSELRTDEGAAQRGPRYSAVAQRLQGADILKRTQTQRTASATNVANQEFSEKVKDDTTGYAVDSGGIDSRGASRAKAQATQVLFKAFDEGVSAEKDIESGKEMTELVKEFDTNYASATDENLAAVAGLVMGGKHRTSQIKMIQHLSKHRAAAQATGDPVQIEKAQNILKQAYADMKDPPFGMGDRALEALRVGDYMGNIYDETASRVEPKLTVQKAATANPDDIKLMYEQVRKGKITGTDLDAFQQTIRDLKASDRYWGDVKNEAKKRYEDILSGTFSENFSTEFPDA